VDGIAGVKDNDQVMLGARFSASYGGHKGNRIESLPRLHARFTKITLMAVKSWLPETMRDNRNLLLWYVRQRYRRPCSLVNRLACRAKSGSKMTFYVYMIASCIAPRSLRLGRSDELGW
jgi:hypothetical protein